MSAVAITALSSLLIACGGADDKSFLQSAGAACDATNAAMMRASDDAFAGGEPTAEELSAFYDVVIGEAEALYDKLAQLAPRNDIESEWNSALALLSDANSRVRAGGLDAFLAKQGDAWSDANARFEELGLGQCADDGT